MREKKAAEGTKDVINQTLPGEGVLTTRLSFVRFMLSFFAIISCISVGTCVFIRLTTAFQVCFPIWQLGRYVAVCTCHVIHTRSLSCNPDNDICTYQSKSIASVVNTRIWPS